MAHILLTDLPTDKISIVFSMLLKKKNENVKDANSSMFLNS